MEAKTKKAEKLAKGTVEKKKRGRPAKVVAEVKRGRGRPRKEVVVRSRSLQTKYQKKELPIIKAGARVVIEVPEVKKAFVPVKDLPNTFKVINQLPVQPETKGPGYDVKEETRKEILTAQRNFVMMFCLIVAIALAVYAYLSKYYPL